MGSDGFLLAVVRSAFGGRGLRILLVDNYDSFTYNLFHLLATVRGVEPIVIKNDDWPGWRRLDLAGFDGAVISPGPGRPQRPADVGLSRTVFAGNLPVLGVCLGHQELCHAYGAVIRAADEPVHGRVSPISHGGEGIFAGIPSPFQGVRYHSLEATDMPDELIVTATAPRRAGGEIVMAVEHRDRPQWGVQFHPESILTQYGAELIENFCRMAGPPHRRGLVLTSRPALPMRPAYDVYSHSQHREVTGARRWRLAARRFSGAVDSSVLFADLLADDSRTLWLDSSEVIPGISRFSIMGRCGPYGELVTARAGTQQVRVESSDGAVQTKHTNLFDYLKTELDRKSIACTDLPFDFAMGYVGYFGYEMKADCGGERVHSSTMDDAALMFCSQAIVIDHEQEKVWALALSLGDADETLEGWWRTAREAIMRSTAHSAGPSSGHRGTATAACESPSADLPLRYRHSIDQYETLVRSCLKEIRDGESYEICLTNMVTAHIDIDSLHTYENLRRHSPVPYGAFLTFPDICVMSASPECFLQISPTGRVRAKPIKGTRPRGGTLEEDALLHAELASAEKDRSENLMIVDLLRNDLGRVAEVGSVCVPTLFEVESYAQVHHLVSTIEAQLRPGVTAVDCLRVAFPGGSMTGAPKVRTMQILDRIEGGSRGVYSGALGYLSLNGAAHLSIIIRTLVAHEGVVTLGSGGAVVALSDPGEEAEEMRLKMLAPLSALRASRRLTTQIDRTTR